MPTLQQCREAGITDDQILCIWSDGRACTLDQLDALPDDCELYLGYLSSDRDIEAVKQTFLKITR